MKSKLSARDGIPKRCWVGNGRSIAVTHDWASRLCNRINLKKCFQVAKQEHGTIGLKDAQESGGLGHPTDDEAAVPTDRTGGLSATEAAAMGPDHLDGLIFSQAELTESLS